MNQHYVPKVYLKNFASKEFASKEKENYFVDVINTKNGESFKSNITRICAEINLYTLDEKSRTSKNKLAIEKAYSDFIERSYDKAYAILTNDKIKHINDIQRVDILSGVLSLYFRNPIHIKRITSYHIDKITHQYNLCQNNSINSFSYLWHTFNLNEISLEQIINKIQNEIIQEFKDKHFEWTMKLLQEKEFLIIEVVKITDNNAQFLTTDNPLCLSDVFDNSNNPFPDSIEFELPINHKYCVKLYFDKTKQNNFIYRTNCLGGAAYTLNKKLIKNASRFYICNEETKQFMQVYDRFFESKPTLEIKMEAIRQILVNDSFRNQNKEVSEILEKYYILFKNNNNLTQEEEKELDKAVIGFTQQQAKGKIEGISNLNAWFIFFETYFYCIKYFLKKIAEKIKSAYDINKFN